MRLLVLITLFPSLLFSQSVYQHLFPLDGKDVSVSVVRSTLGDRMAVGGRLVDEQSGQFSGYLATIGSSGDLLWASELFSDNNAFVWDVLSTPAGGWIVALNTISVHNTGELVWFDASGQMTLRKRANEEKTSFLKLFRLADGNFVVAGYGPAGSGNTGGLLMKLSSGGQVIWSTTCYANEGILEFRDVYEDEQGFLYVAGIQYVTGLLGDAVLGRFSPDGEAQWLRRTGFLQENQFSRIVPFDGGASLLLGGNTQTAAGFLAVRLCNVRFDGTLIWMNTYSIPGADVFLHDLVNAPGIAYFTFVEQGGNPNTGMGVGRINVSGDLLSVRNYEPSGKMGGAPHMALTAQNELLLADGLLDGQGRSLFVVRTDIFGNVPPCCLLSGNLQVAAAVPEWVFPNFENLDGPSLLNATASPTMLNFETYSDVCPEINTDFTLSDTLICPGECITLTLSNPTPGATYTWLTPGGTADPQDPNRICYAGDGNFGIVPQVNGCAQNPASKTIMVNATGNDDVPTAFTPDGDGTNDTFRPLIVCPVTDFLFEIYNRWGQKVFETSDPEDAWDGRSDDEVPAVSDVYVWKLSYRSNNGPSSERKGQVTLVR